MGPGSGGRRGPNQVIWGVGPLLGKLEHTWAKPFFGQKSVRLQRISMKLGGFNPPDAAENLEWVPGPGGAQNWIFELGGWGAHVCYSLPRSFLPEMIMIRVKMEMLGGIACLPQTLGMSTAA